MEDLECEKCSSVNLEFVRFRMKNNVEQLRKQCFDCGYLHSWNYKRTRVFNFYKLPEMDGEMRAAHREKRINGSHIKKTFSELRSWSFRQQVERYRNVYLKSKEWKSKRDLVMEYYDYNCQKCNNKAIDVHHLTYENIFLEKFKDLIPLCRSCHENEHNTYSLNSTEE